MSGKMGAAAAAIGMVLLILDPVTAMEGARQGIGTCLQTLIPSLFPMMVLGIYLTGALDGSLILAGWLGGYPVGAKVVDQAYRSGRLSKGQAQRMLVACNQCGPAFLFGVGHQILGRGWACWLLWAILLLSAGIAGALLTKRSGLIPGGRTQPISFPQALENGVKVMGTVCGWVVLFRVALGFLERWGLDRASVPVRAVTEGILELSNGCIVLMEASDPAMRFLICAGLMSFGGACVSMQTCAVTSPALNKTDYFLGKLLQCCIATSLAWIAGQLIWGGLGRTILAVAVTAGAILGAYLKRAEKRCSIYHGIGV